MKQLPISPFKIRNIRLFIAFRVFFNSRFYYPVFAILFLDFGLTLDQFAVLNLVWAITIVVLEIPSGALADSIGRKNLMVFSGVCMVLEMALLCFVPLGNPKLIFYLFLANRILSGSAEAAASGADEALAYDSLKEEGDTDDWGRVLVRQMGFRSIGFVVAMSLGAAVYDPALLTHVTDWLGMDIGLNQNITLKFPLYLTLATAFLTLFITLSMKSMEPEKVSRPERSGEAILKTFRLTMAAGKWILETPFALVIIIAGMIFDHAIRMMTTLSSEYYRLIDLPESAFGLIGSGLALLGLFIPRLALKLAEKHTPTFNMGMMTLVTLMGFWGATLFVPVFGIIPLALLSSIMYFNGFFVSRYLNRITDSAQRATVLSFKGLSFNLAYGFICLLYAVFLSLLRSRERGLNPTISGDALQNNVFIQSIHWFPWYFALVFCAFLIFAARWLRNSKEHRTKG